MTTFRCFACGEKVEVEKIKELDLVEVKPCEICLRVAEEDAYERGREEAEGDE